MAGSTRASLHRTVLLQTTQTRLRCIFLQKGLSGEPAKIWQAGAQPGVVPVPPGQLHHLLGDQGCIATPDQLCRVATNDCIWRHILGHHRTRGNNGPMAYGHFGLDQGTMADPGIMPDVRPPTGAVREPIRIICCIIPIERRAIVKVMQRGLLHRVIRGSNTGGTGNI